MPKKGSHQPKSYPTDMAHPTERRNSYISRDIVRFSLVPLDLLWVLLLSFSSESSLHPSYSIIPPEFTRPSLDLVVGLASEAESVKLFNCPHPRGFQTTTHSANEPEDLRARLSRTLLTTTVSNSKSLHMYIYIHIYICYLNRGFLLYYIRIPLGFYNNLNSRIFLFFVMLSVSILNYH